MIEDDNNNEDILIEIISSIVIGKILPILLLGYLIFKKRLTYNKE